MKTEHLQQMGCVLLFALAMIMPLLIPAIVTQMTLLWLMILFALTWDILGGQMGYNSFGNVVFFGLGCYIVAVLQRDAGLNYFVSLFSGMALSGIVSVLFTLFLGPFILAVRGQYFAICTLGLGIAIGDAFAGWDYVGAGSGFSTELFPGSLHHRDLFFYYLMFTLALWTFLTLRWLYSTRFGLALNAIRDDEDKAEAMGLHTTRYKVMAWMIAAFFLALAGGPFANLMGYIDPRETAFAGATFGVWMILMAILGGKGTLWGPVIGAVIFHLTQELFWTYLFGWQRVALGLLIVIIVIFFPQGILGWWRQHHQAEKL